MSFVWVERDGGFEGDGIMEESFLWPLLFQGEDERKKGFQL